MSDLFTLDTTMGRVELSGDAPWKVRAIGDGSFEIVDAANKPARPTVWQAMKGGGSKPNQNVIWAKRAMPEQIVKELNEAKGL